MLLYKKTFDNIKTLNCNFPIEDQYYADNTSAIVADGITRDPVGIFDLSEISFEEMLKLYPRPSGAELAAKTIIETFSKSEGCLLEKLTICNQEVKKLNDLHISRCDYLQNDYYGAVASCINIEGNKLHYAYICDCGVIVYDKDGKIKFQTEDDKELYSDPYINQIGIPWNLPDARVIIRRDYRNNLGNIQDKHCVSYGALTGEEDAISFIRTGTIDLENTDTVVIYSDGFTNLLQLPEFIKLVINFDSNNFEEYIEKISKSNYEKYGKEKTLLIMKK